MTIDEIRMQALQLPADERELLAVELFGSLSGGETQAEIEAEWSEEIMARSDAYRAGTTQAFDAQESLERVRAILAQRTLP